MSYASREKRLEYNKRYHAKHPDKYKAIKRAALLKSHGLTQHEFELMVAGQENRCAICAKVFTKTPHVDHNHLTGKTRGLLCGPCNHGLGLFYDSEETLFRATQYLRSYK